MKKNIVIFMLLGLLCSDQALFCMRRKSRVSPKVERARSAREQQRERGRRLAQIHKERQEAFKVAIDRREGPGRLGVLRERDAYFAFAPRDVLPCPHLIEITIREREDPAVLSGDEGDELLSKRMRSSTSETRKVNSFTIPVDLLFECFVNLPEHDVLGLRLINREWNELVEGFFRTKGWHRGIRSLTITPEECAQREPLLYKLSITRRLFRRIELVFFANTQGRWKPVTDSLMGQIVGLEMDCQHGFLTDGSCVLLKSELQKLPHLRRLAINGGQSSRLTNGGLGDLCHGLIVHANLQQLMIDLSECGRLTDCGLAHLSRALRNLQLLQQLTLLFSYAAITSGGFALLKQVLPYLIDLQQLTLGFRDTRIGDDGLADFGSVLAKLSKLRQFAIYLKGCSNLTDGGLDNLGTALGEAPFLEELTIGLGESPQQTGFGWARLIKSLQVLPCLQQLTFHLESFSWPIDDDFARVGNELKELTSLQDLTLHLENCYEAEAVGLAHLIMFLQGLSNLRGVSIYLSGWYQLTNDGLWHLGEALKGLPLLEQLTIDVEACNRLTDEILPYLRDMLQSLTNVKQLRLNLVRCDRLSEHKVEELRFFLGSVPQLDLRY